jgi:hypothetical protein
MRNGQLHRRSDLACFFKQVTGRTLTRIHVSISVSISRKQKLGLVQRGLFHAPAQEGIRSSPAGPIGGFISSSLQPARSLRPVFAWCDSWSARWRGQGAAASASLAAGAAASHLTHVVSSPRANGVQRQSVITVPVIPTNADELSIPAATLLTAWCGQQFR